MRQSGMWNGRFKEHVEADVMDMECGVLCVARRPVLTELLSTVEKIINRNVHSNGVECRFV